MRDERVQSCNVVVIKLGARDGVSRLFRDCADSRPDKRHAIMISCCTRNFVAFEIDRVHHNVTSDDGRRNANGGIADSVVFVLYCRRHRTHCNNIIFLLSSAYACFAQRDTSGTFCSSARGALRIRRLLLRRVARS